MLAKLQEIGLLLHVNCELAEHPDVLVIKLISGKVTYVHRALVAGVSGDRPRAGALADGTAVARRAGRTRDAWNLGSIWSSRTGYIGEQTTVWRAKLTREDLVASLNRRCDGRGRLPWQG